MSFCFAVNVPADAGSCQQRGVSSHAPFLNSPDGFRYGFSQTSSLNSQFGSVALATVEGPIRFNLKEMRFPIEVILF